MLKAFLTNREAVFEHVTVVIPRDYPKWRLGTGEKLELAEVESHIKKVYFNREAGRDHATVVVSCDCSKARGDSMKSKNLINVSVGGRR